MPAMRPLPARRERRGGGHRWVPWIGRAADGLTLGAAPAFALAAWHAAQAAPVLCSGTLDGAGVGGLVGGAASGMAGMYALIALFHLAPWLRLSSARRRKGAAPGN